MMLPFPSCPLKEQSGFGQQRDRVLLLFIHVCCQKMRRKSSWHNRLRGLLDKVNNTSLKKRSILSYHQKVCK